MAVFVTRMVQPVNKMELVSLKLEGHPLTVFYATLEDGNIVVYPTSDAGSVIRGSCVLIPGAPARVTGAPKIKSISGYQIYQVTADAVFGFSAGSGGGA